MPRCPKCALIVFGSIALSILWICMASVLGAKRTAALAFLTLIVGAVHWITSEPGQGVPELDHMDPRHDEEPSRGDAIEIDERRRM